MTRELIIQNILTNYGEYGITEETISLRYIFMQTIRGIKEVVSNVRELDDALTNIAYTMDVSNKQLKQIGESSLQAAKDLNTSVSKVLDAVKTYANATETAESIIEKSKPTIMMSNVTGMDTSQTVDILQGVMEQFDLAEDQLMHISDVMQTVSMSMPYDFANGVKELSEGIKASGSTAKDAGYDLENYTALLGTLIAKTRQSGGELGRSLRTMFVRTTKASTSALANGEVAEDDLSNAEKALRRVGIEVRSDIDTFKSFDQIMGELYEKVDSLSDVDLSNIAYEVASTRQTNVFKMMIKAYGDYQEMAEKAYNADNVTLINQEKYAESLTGKMGELAATWEKISNDTINSSFLKGLADAGIGVSSLIEKIGLLKSVSSLVDTLQSLSMISIDADGNGLISQFNNLKTAIEGVTSAISGGGTSGGSGSEGAPSSSPSMSAGAGGKGSAVGGLISAVEGIKTATDEALGTGGGKDGEGGGTGAIGQFEQLKDAVDDVTASIGGGSSEGGQGSGGNDGENADSLIGSIVELGDTTEEILTGGGESEGESGGVIGRFEEFSDVIEEAKDHVMGISEGLDEIDGKEVECTIRVNIETNGSLPGIMGSGMNLGSAQYDAKYTGNAHVEGTALASGNWAVQSDEKEALLGEVGYEIIVRNGRFFTVGENGAEMFPIKKGDIVFNHEQSEELLKNGHISGRGKAYADGTVGGGKFITSDGAIARPLQPGDRMYDMLQKFNAYFDSIDRNVEKLTPNSFYDHQKQMEQMANQITNYNNVINNNKNVQPVVNHINVTLPNVTNSTSADELLRDLQSINTKKYQVNW